MKILLTVLVVVFAATSIFTGIQYFQQRNDINRMQSQISSVKADVATLKSSLVSASGKSEFVNIGGSGKSHRPIG